MAPDSTILSGMYHPSFPDLADRLRLDFDKKNLDLAARTITEKFPSDAQGDIYYAWPYNNEAYYWLIRSSIT